MDDMQEAQIFANRQDAFELFVSCWTKEAIEDIPQWAMYGDRLEGVRLSLPVDPFDWHHLDFNYEHEGYGFQIVDIEAPYGELDVFARDYVLVPTSAYQRRDFGVDVAYLPSREAYLKALIKFEEDGGISIPYGSHMLAAVKEMHWSFQKEYRFIISAAWAPNRDYSTEKEAYIEELCNGWRTKGRMSAKSLHVDLRLSPSAFDSAEVTMGPLATEATQILVESLVATHAPNIKIKDSALKGTLRAKRN